MNLNNDEIEISGKLIMIIASIIVIVIVGGVMAFAYTLDVKADKGISEGNIIVLNKPNINLSNETNPINITLSDNLTGINVDYASAVSGIRKKIGELEVEIVTLEESMIEKGEEEFGNVLKEVMDRSITVEIDYSNKTFDEVYDYYMPIFRNKYSGSIDFEKGTGEYVQTVQELIQGDFVGDCDDYALFLYIIAEKMNYEVVYKTGIHKMGRGGHAWIAIKKDDVWIEYDSTNNYKGENVMSEDYYDIIKR